MTDIGRIPDPNVDSWPRAKNYAIENNQLHRLHQNFSCWLADRVMDAERRADKAMYFALASAAWSSVLVILFAWAMSGR